MILVPAADGVAEAYLSEPDGPARGAVLLVMDAIGLRPRIAEMADEIASWGYTVLAPNVFYRVGTAEETSPRTDLRIPENRAAYFAKSPVMTWVGALTPDLVARDAEAYADFLASRTPGPLAVTGYCFGARLATRIGGQLPQVVAVGGFHGAGLVTDAIDSPHLSIRPGIAYVYGHADNDRGMPPEAVDELGAVLATVDPRALNAIYPGAQHGYTMADSSAWNAEGCARHFRELRATLDRAF
jgi:carboxymethylenebutenolidase